MDITWSDSESNWTVTLTPAVIPDNEARYLLRPNANALFDDNITLTVDSNGLLQTATATITDKTVASLADLVKTAGSVLTFGAAMAPASLAATTREATSRERATREKPKKFTPELRSFHQDIDPYAKGSLPDIPELTSPRIKINDNLSYQFKANFALKIAPPTLSPPIKMEMSPGETFDRIGEINLRNATIHGIVVRVPIPYTITITEKLTMTPINITVTKKDDVSHTTEEPGQSSEKIEETQSKIVMLPDINQDYIWPINRRYFVADQTTITLKDGMITTFQQTKPSMVAGIVGIPKTILEALVPIPTIVRSTQSSNLTYIDTSLKEKAEIKKLQSQ